MKKPRFSSFILVYVMFAALLSGCDSTAQPTANPANDSASATAQTASPTQAPVHADEEPAVEPTLESIEPATIKIGVPTANRSPSVLANCLLSRG